MIDFVFFDVGGTLLHPDWGEVARRFGAPELAPRLLAAEDDARYELDRRLAAGLPVDGPSYLDAALALAGVDEAARAAGLPALWRAHLARNFWRRVDPEVAALDALKALGLPLGVISNSEGKVRELLDETGLLGRFSPVVDSGIEGVAKPDPEIFRRACARAAVAPGRALYVGDVFAVDVLGARGAGLMAAFLDRGRGAEMPEGAFAVRSLRELVPLCERLRKPDLTPAG